ncbi:MAG: hypothetical protein H7125_00900 [Proteobacteria bacterium]|nr:hypothetical protein [Burkholderiales bacterium]
MRSGPVHTVRSRGAATAARAALLAGAAIAAGLAQAQNSPVAAVAPLGTDEIAVSTGSWYCTRYLEAAKARVDSARAAVLADVRQFALGYVYGVSEAVGRPFPETAINDTRIVGLLDKGCGEDPGRAVRDATLLAGRAMLDLPEANAPSAEGAPDAAPTSASTLASASSGAVACRVYLAQREAGDNAPAERRNLLQNWADGYINARFERAGRGLIPTAKNKALMLERFSAACMARPEARVRDAARSVVESTLPQK